MIIDFVGLLAILTTSFFILAFYLMYRSGETLKKLKTRKLRVLPSPTLSSFLLCAHYILLVSIALVSAYSIWVGSRPLIYFILYSLTFITSVLLLLISPPKKLRRTIIFTLVIVSAITSLIPIAQNRGIIFGPDQWRDLLATNSIRDLGNFNTASEISGSYYSLVPLISILIASISLITGSTSFLPFMVLSVVTSIIISISLYYILLKLTHTHMASVLGVFIFLSIPRLTVVQVIPSSLSIAIGSLLIFLLIRHSSLPRRSTFVTIIILALASLVFHPAGIIVVLTLSGGFIAVNFVGLNGKARYHLPTVTGLLVVLAVLSWAYWNLDNAVLTSIAKPLDQLYRTLLGGVGKSIYIPQYYATGFEKYAYAWALPISLSAAYVTITFKDFILKARNKEVLKRKMFNPFTFSAGAVAILIFATGFVSVAHAPGGGLERYLDAPAYLLAVLPSAVVGAYVINSRRKLELFCMILILSSFVYIGSSSPDWAPFEHPEFGAVRTTYLGYTEARTIVDFLPEYSYIYADYDIPISLPIGGVAAIKGIPLETPSSYQTTRYVLTGIEKREFSPCDPEYRDKIFIMKSNRIENVELFNEHINIIYNSDNHVALKSAT